jgi:hypothetical protein
LEMIALNFYLQHAGKRSAKNDLGNHKKTCRFNRLLA